MLHEQTRMLPSAFDYTSIIVAIRGELEYTV